MASIAGFVEAISLFVRSPVFDRDLMSPFVNRLSSLQSLSGVNLVCPFANRLSNTCSFTLPDIDSITLLAALDLEGICASSGSACSSGSLTPSHVLSALGKSEKEASSLIRFSLGRETTDNEIDFVLEKVTFAIERIRMA